VSAAAEGAKVEVVTEEEHDKEQEEAKEDTFGEVSGPELPPLETDDKEEEKNEGYLSFMKSKISSMVYDHSN
jgi:hypothetical protein